MEERKRSKRLLAMVGGFTAAATATGGIAQAAPAAPASAGPVSGPTANLGVTAGAGMFEPCSAYFGFGKDAGALSVVEFDVADVDGDDGVDHGVDLDGDGDTDVVLVLENDEGDTLECVPFELTADQWDDEWDGAPGELPDYPGPGHYVYPSVNLDPEIDEFGPVTEVGFRVTGVPGEHTLVSPEGVAALTEHFLDPEALIFDPTVDPAVIGYIAAQANPAAAQAFEDALDACANDESFDTDDPDYEAAVAVLDALTGREGDDDLNCLPLGFLNADASLYLSVARTVDYVEPIRLSTPESPTTTQPTTTTTTDPSTEPSSEQPPPSPQARPVTAQPTFTG